MNEYQSPEVTELVSVEEDSKSGTALVIPLVLTIVASMTVLVTHSSAGPGGCMHLA